MIIILIKHFFSTVQLNLVQKNLIRQLEICIKNAFMECIINIWRELRGHDRMVSGFIIIDAISSYDH